MNTPETPIPNEFGLDDLHVCYDVEDRLPTQACCISFRWSNTGIRPNRANLIIPQSLVLLIAASVKYMPRDKADHTLTAKDMENLRHMLGADSSNPGYRNYFAAGHDEQESMERLVATGLARRVGPTGHGNGEILYAAINAGKAAFDVPLEAEP